MNLKEHFEKNILMFILYSGILKLKLDNPDSTATFLLP